MVLLDFGLSLRQLCYHSGVSAGFESVLWRAGAAKVHGLGVKRVTLRAWIVFIVFLFFRKCCLGLQITSGRCINPKYDAPVVA